MNTPPEDEFVRRVEELEKSDARTRVARAKRSTELNSLQREFPPMTMGFVGGGYESSWLFLEAMHCYINGSDLASLLCSHASCERELAGRVNHLGPQAPKGWERWGLGALLQYAAKQRWYAEPSQKLLEEINRKRREFYHFREEWTAESVIMRTYSQLPWRGKEGIQEDTAQVAQQDALQALRAAFVVRAEG